MLNGRMPPTRPCATASPLTLSAGNAWRQMWRSNTHSAASPHRPRQPGDQQAILASERFGSQPHSNNFLCIAYRACAFDAPYSSFQSRKSDAAE
eukprot:5981169-Amphidinium_carterae.3